MSFLGWLSLTKNLSAEQESRAVAEEEKATLESELTEAKGLSRFSAARMIIDIDHLEAHLRGTVYPSLWLESETLGRKIVVIAYTDKVLKESQLRAIRAHFPTAERL